MAKILVPPPSIETMASYLVEWIARHMRAKVTLTVHVDENENFIEEYDGRVN